MNTLSIELPESAPLSFRMTFDIFVGGGTGVRCSHRRSWVGPRHRRSQRGQRFDHARRPDRNTASYLIMDGLGQVSAYGDATNLGGLAPGSTDALNPAMAIFAGSPHGYWISNAEGRVWTFGDALFDGDMSGTKLNGAIIPAAGF